MYSIYHQFQVLARENTAQENGQGDCMMENMEYAFLNNDNSADGAIPQKIYDNRRARKLLLKELAGLQAAFCHNDLKILYIDVFHLIFFAAHKYRAVHATDIGQILMHETYWHKVSSNKMKAVFWATSQTEVRYIDKH